MPPGDKCDGHDTCMARFNEGLHNIEMKYAAIEGSIAGFTKSTSDFVTAIRKDIYSKDGIMDRTGNHGMQLLLQWGVLAGLLITIVVTFIKQ